MASVDPNADLEIAEGTDDLVVRIPLAEAPGLWIREYLPLAREQALAAEVREEPGAVRLMVRVPLDASHEDVAGILDAALGLVDKAKAATNERDVSRVTAESHIRSWWSRQQADVSP